MAERHANHANSDHANRQQLPIASDTAPEHEANLIPHECGSNRPSSNLDATENSEAEPSNECEERPERKRALSTPASKQAPANMADSHHGTNKFSNDQHALKKDEGCRFSGGEAWQDPDKTNKASMAYFCEIYLFNGGARTQFIRQGLRQNDPFVFPRLNYFNQDDTRLFNACMLEWCASMDAAPACPAELQQEPLQEINNTQASENKTDWEQGNQYAALSSPGEGKGEATPIATRYTPIAARTRESALEVMRAPAHSAQRAAAQEQSESKNSEATEKADEQDKAEELTTAIYDASEQLRRAEAELEIKMDQQQQAQQMDMQEKQDAHIVASAEVAKAEVQKEEAKIKLALAQSTLSAAKEKQEGMLLLASSAVQQQMQGISASQAQLGFNLEHGPALEATAEFPAGITASEVEPTVMEQLRVVEAALRGGLAAQQPPARGAAQGAATAAGLASADAQSQADATCGEIYEITITNAHEAVTGWIKNHEAKTDSELVPMHQDVIDAIDELKAADVLARELRQAHADLQARDGDGVSQLESHPAIEAAIQGIEDMKLHINNLKVARLQALRAAQRPKKQLSFSTPGGARGEEPGLESKTKTSSGPTPYKQGRNYFTAHKSSSLPSDQTEGASANGQVTILTMGAKSSAYSRAAARKMEHSEWMQLPPREAFKLWSLCMMEVYTLLTIFIDNKDPSLLAGIAVNDGRGLWLRMMRRFFAPDTAKATAVEAEIRALRQDVGTPQNWETTDELMMRYAALCRKYRQYSRITENGTRHCLQNDKHMQRDLLLNRTAARMKRTCTHITKQQNKGLDPDGNRRCNSQGICLWNIDEIRNELRVVEKTEKQMLNKAYGRPPVGKIRLPKGGEAHFAYDMRGYVDVPICEEANYGEDMERMPVGTYPEGSCRHHITSTTHTTEMCSKEKENGGGDSDGGTPQKKPKKKEFKAMENKPRLWGNNKNGNPDSETTYFSDEEKSFCNSLVFPSGDKGACWRCGHHFDADRNAKPPKWHKCPPGSTTVAARKNWMRGLRSRMKAGTRTGWLVKKAAGSANQAKQTKDKKGERGGKIDRDVLRTIVKEQVAEQIASGATESKSDEDVIELEQEIFNRMMELHEQKKVRSAHGPAVQPPVRTCARPPHHGGAAARIVAPADSLSSNVCPTNRSEDTADGPTQTSPTAWPSVDTPHSEAESPGRGKEREQGAWTVNPGARARREAEGDADGVPSSDPRPTYIVDALTNLVPVSESTGTDRPLLMHAHMASGTSGNTDTTDTTEPESAIENAVPWESARKWEWSEGTWMLHAHAAEASKGEPPGERRARWHVNTFAQTTAAEAIGHPDTLFMHISSEEHFSKLHHSPVLIDTGELSHLANSAPVRAPAMDSEGNVDATLTRRDLCEAIARLETGQYRRLVVPTQMQSTAMNPKAPGYSEELERLIREVIEKGHRLPSFYDPKQQASLVAEYRARNQIPDVKPKCAVLCAGVGCDAIAALATHYEIVLLVDVCHHATEELRRRFPNAMVLPLDLREKDHLAVIAKYRVDVVLFGIPCQPSSMCNPHQKPDDVRLKMTALCLTAAVSMKPTLMMAENVAGFVLKRPKHFKQVLDTMEREKYSVSWHITNAKWFGSPTQRLRVFIIGHRFADNKAIEGLTADIKTQKQAYRDGLKTYRTVHELLSLYRTDMNTYKGVLLHQRRKMGSDDVAPARIVSTKAGKLKGSLPTLTSKMRQSARSLANYKVREIDEADKSKTLVMDKQDFAVCQGCHRSMRWSEARRCSTRCPGCTLPDGGSRGAPGDIQRGNIVNPNQVRFKLERLVRPLARACAARRKQHSSAHAVPSPDETEGPTEIETRLRAAAKRVAARVLAAKQQQASMARAETAIASSPEGAIVDSGASGIFVTSGVELDDARPAPGQLVKVANDQLEPIAEQGLLPGTTLPAKKVASFARTLVAVAPLTALVGQITFDTERVYAVSTGKLSQGDGGAMGRTPIGSVTADHLYSFNLPALVRHCKQFAHLLPAPNAAAAALLASAKAQTQADSTDTQDTNTAPEAEPNAGSGGASHGGANNGGASSGGAELHVPATNPESAGSGGASSGGAELDTRGATANAKSTLTDTAATCPVAAAVSDQEAARVLRIFHSTWGHMTGPEMAKLHDSGTDFGADVSREQILSTQFWCKGCASGRFDKKPYAKRDKKIKPDENLKCGEHIQVDIIAQPEEARSIKYIDNDGKGHGGHRFAIFAMCEASSNAWQHPIDKKSDIETALEALIAHIEIEAAESCDYNGETPRVKRITSDRDANLTSKEAAKLFLEKRIKQVLTATHGTNQTPRLDRKIRQCQTTARSILINANLGAEFWEFALNFAIMIENNRATSANRLGRSPQHRWRGTPTKMGSSHVYIFGAAARVHLRHEQRALGSKISPAAKGDEKGRYRYMGPDRFIGGESKGDIIYDLRRNRTVVERNVKYDPRTELLTPYPQESGKGEDSDACDSDEYEEGDDETKEEVEDKAPELEDTWTWAYTVKSRSATFRSIANRFGLDVFELLTHNTDDAGRVRKPDGRIAKNQEIWLPAECETKIIDVPIEEAKSIIDRDSEDFAGRIGHRKVGQYGWHYYAVIEGRDGKGRYRILYDDGDGTYNHKYLRREVIAKTILTKGHGHVHMEKALINYHKEMVENEKRKEAANAAYSRHAAHHAMLKKKGEMPDFAKVLGSAIGDEHSDELLEIARSEFGPMRAAATEARALAAGLSYAGRTRHVGFNVQSIDANTMAAKAIWEEGIDRWCAGINARITGSAHLIQELSHLRASEFPTPKTYAEAMKGDFAKWWKEAIHEEIQNLTDHGTFEWVKPPLLPNGRRQKVYLDGTWAFKAKSNDKGQIDRLKARLVARGFKQRFGHDFVASMAPVGKLTTFRAMLAEMAHSDLDMCILDVKSAYLQATLEIPQLMKVPLGVTAPGPGFVMKLIKSLYGLKNAGRAWHTLFKADLLSWGFVAGTADTCLFTKHDPKTGNTLRVLLFVDDCFCITDKGSGMIGDFKDQLESKYEFSSSDSDTTFLGLTVTKCKNGSYHLGQVRYIEDVLTKYGLMEVRKIRTPSNGDAVTKLDCPDLEPGTNPLQKKYCELIGIMRWIERCTRPDLTVTLSELGKVQANPGEKHWKKLLHLLKYVASTRHLGIIYGGPRTSDADGPLLGYVDSNWGGDGDDYKSRGGFVFLSWQSPICWSSYKATATALSSCEAEYMAASIATQEAIWLRYLFSDLGYGEDLSCTSFGNLCEKDYIKAHLSNRVHRGEVPMTLFNDNRAAILLSRNPVLHKRSRHIHIRYHFVRDHCNNGHVELAYISTNENLADLLTKCLAFKTHSYLTGKLLFDLKGLDLFRVDGIEVTGKTPIPAGRFYKAPDLTRYRKPPLLDLSDHDTEAAMRKEYTAPTQITYPSAAPRGIPAIAATCSVKLPEEFLSSFVKRADHKDIIAQAIRDVLSRRAVRAA